METEFVELDGSLQVNLSGLGLAPHSRYLVTKEPDGRLILTPVAATSESEQSLTANAALRERIEANRADPSRMILRPSR
ncbi:MAG: hypothetical protein WD271_04315 [Acidimicrobiia bacterium]